LVLSLRFLGEPRIERDGQVLELPPSKKTRALLAYLAITGRPHRRDRLCSLFWEVPDDPRGALRWSLSKIRGLVDEPGTARIVADRDTVAFQAQGARVDLVELRRKLAGAFDSATTEELGAAAGAFAGEFLEGLELPENHDFHAWCIAEREEARALHARILWTLVERLKPRPESALPHARALVGVVPHDEAAWAILVRLLAAAGRRREAEDQCDLGRRVLEDTGAGATGPLLKVWRNLRKTQATDGTTARPELVSIPAVPQLARLPRWPSVAVLPLRAVSSDSAIPHLADAITEDLVTSLSRDRSMAVIAHGAILSAERLPLDVRQIAQQIGAQYIVEGSVRRTDDTLVVAVRLVDGLDAKHIWAERCVQKLDARLAIDDQFARKIAAAIRVEVEAVEAAKAQGASSEELDVRASYHMGLREMYRFTHAGLIAAQAHFERAVRLDPNFAATHARLSYVHIQHYWYGSREAREVALDAALTAAKRAVALDPKDALGHFSMGRVCALRSQFDRAMPELETAIRLNPSLAQAYFGLGQASWYAGRAREAVRLLDTAIELNPHDPHLWSFFHDQSEAFFALGQFADAERAARAAARMPNATHWPWVTLASVLGAASKPEQAADALRELLSRRPEYSLSRAEKEFAHFSDKSFIARYLEGLKKAGMSQ
jgi:DNA-binding SARP family transcriptional activator/Tfp pilus assembly protein PilF